MRPSGTAARGVERRRRAAPDPVRSRRRRLTGDQRTRHRGPLGEAPPTFFAGSALPRGDPSRLESPVVRRSHLVQPPNGPLDDRHRWGWRGSLANPRARPPPPQVDPSVLALAHTISSQVAAHSGSGSRRAVLYLSRATQRKLEQYGADHVRGNVRAFAPEPRELLRRALRRLVLRAPAVAPRAAVPGSVLAAGCWSRDPRYLLARRSPGTKTRRSSCSTRAARNVRPSVVPPGPGKRHPVRSNSGL
jgi:hypothetical protein